MTRFSSTFTSAILAAAIGASGCMGAPEVAGDDESADFGGAFAKADGSYSLCELRKVLELVNRSDTSQDSLETILEGIRTRGRAAEGIIAHRAGPDGDFGTADDDLFDDLDELDGVPYVGPVTLDRLVDSVSTECDSVLATRPFIDSTTFAGTTGGGWTRDNVELEATFTASGVTGQRLRAALLTERNNGETIFEDITENGDLEAFTYGYSPDEMPWDRDSHRLRERMPYVMLTIEPGRFEPDDGPRELSLGTDIMDDTYFDTLGYDLVHRDYVLRGRARWDDPTTIRRLLIAAKEGGEVGPDGIKRAAKVDVRVDSPNDDQISSLEADVMGGTVAWSWGGNRTPVEPVRVIYNALQADNILPDIDGHEDVLLLEPMAHLRSTRSRFHYNEAGLNSVRNVNALGDTRVQHAVDYARMRIAEGDVTGADLELLEELATTGDAILDRTLLAERANADLTAAGLPAGFDAMTLPLPASYDGAASREELEQHRVIAESISEVLHEYSEVLDDADRILSGATDNDWDDYADYFIEWMRSQDTTLGRNQVVEPYLERYEAMDAATSLVEYNTWVGAQRDDGDDDFEDFVEVDEAGWALVGSALRLEMLKIHQRQIDAAGTTGRALWFDEAREFYVPASSRQTGNLIIDTTDMTDMVSHTEWLALSEDERRIDQQIPAASVFNTVFVNEVQIELGSEEAYVARVNELQALIDAGTATDEDRAILEGVEFVFGEYRGALTFLAELKEDRVQSRLRRGGADDVEWGPAERGKGETALLMLADEL